jgi:hypothetical protein
VIGSCKLIVVLGTSEVGKHIFIRPSS